MIPFKFLTPPQTSPGAQPAGGPTGINKFFVPGAPGGAGPAAAPPPEAGGGAPDPKALAAAMGGDPSLIADTPFGSSYAEGLISSAMKPQTSGNALEGVGRMAQLVSGYYHKSKDDARENERAKATMEFLKKNDPETAMIFASADSKTRQAIMNQVVGDRMASRREDRAESRAVAREDRQWDRQQQEIRLREESAERQARAAAKITEEQKQAEIERKTQEVMKARPNLSPEEARRIALGLADKHEVTKDGDVVRIPFDGGPPQVIKKPLSPQDMSPMERLQMLREREAASAAASGGQGTGTSGAGPAAAPAGGQPSAQPAPAGGQPAQAAAQPAAAGADQQQPAKDVTAYAQGMDYKRPSEGDYKYAAEESWKADAKRREELNTSATNGRMMRDRAAVIEKALEKGNTGAFQNFITMAGKAAAQAGLLSQEQLAKISAEEVIAAYGVLLAPTAKEGLPGSVSNMEFQAFLSAVPGLLNTPEGNKKLIGIMKAFGERSIERQKLIQEWQAERRKYGLSTQMNEGFTSWMLDQEERLAKKFPLPDFQKIDNDTADAAGRRRPGESRQQQLERQRAEGEWVGYGPKPGEVVGANRFKGGNPNDQKNWEPAR